MKKLVAFVGSPHENGRTATLVKEIIRGAENVGVQTKIYFLNNMNIKCCQGCMYCKNEGEGCSIKDDMQMVYKDFKKADIVVIGSPIYVYQVSAQTKILFDRLYALLDKSYKPRFDKKRAVIVYSQGQANEGINNSYFDINSKFFSGFGLDVIDTIIYSGFDKAKKEELMARAFIDGENLVR